jgi:hypothetical protein
MSTKVLALLLISSCIAIVVPSGGYGQMINPYLPMNAVTAEPLTPYNIWDIPDTSPTSYLPCRDCGSLGAQLPDIPPIYEPVPGPFNFPVPVP